LSDVRDDPFIVSVHKVGNDPYYRVVAGYLIFFDVLMDERIVNVSAIERPH